MRVRCEAAVAEKESEEASGEKFEYQAEVCLCFFYILPSAVYPSFCFADCPFRSPSCFCLACFILIYFLSLFNHESCDFLTCGAEKLESFLVCLTQNWIIIYPLVKIGSRQD